ncbi:MAG TPA: NAD(P)H-binding protein [Streptosporangiaceae bacterium]|nr:NAD(P)H-binding protein [Streptosporangiaceae bacterium]
MKLFVLGGSGFLGGYVLHAAARDGYQVLALARSAAAAGMVAARGARPVAGDLADPAQLDQAFAAAAAQGCDVLVCLASLGFGHGPAIVAAAEEAGIKRAVFVSTTAVTTALHPPTKQVRLAAEEEIRRSGLDWTILRPTMIYGDADDRNLSRLLRLLTKTPVLPVPGRGSGLHQPVHVADAAAAVLAAVQRPAAVGSLYNVAGPEPLPFGELLRACARAVRSGTRFLTVPLAPLVTLARGYERISRQPRLRAEQLLRLGEDKAFAIDDAVRDLGYAPRPFADGIAEEARLLGLIA